MTEQPLVSVIIPTYNRAAVIPETIENTFQQTYPNIEVIVVDDGSTDETQSVLASYGGRIRWTYQKNAGPAAARNRGIAMARGEIIAFQDSDDAWYPTKIGRQVALLRRFPESVACICNSIVQLGHIVVRSFESARVKAPIEEGVWLNPAEVLATRFILFNQAIAIRREVLLRMGGFDESFRILEDMEMGLRLSLEGPWTFIREPLATRQAKLERSLVHEATTRVVCENMVRILELTLRNLNNSNRVGNLKSLLQQALNCARRERRAAQIRDSSVLGARAFGWAWQAVERYRAAVYRRSPWFPQMKVSSGDCVFHNSQYTSIATAIDEA